MIAPAVAQGCGIATGLTVRDEAEPADLVARSKKPAGPPFARVAIVVAEPAWVLPERDGVVLKRRFRAAPGL